jgi:hypothetical protein
MHARQEVQIYLYTITFIYFYNDNNNNGLNIWLHLACCPGEMACPDEMSCSCYQKEKSALSSRLRKAFIDEKCHEEIIKRIFDTKIKPSRIDDGSCVIIRLSTWTTFSSEIGDTYMHTSISIYIYIFYKIYFLGGCSHTPVQAQAQAWFLTKSSAWFASECGKALSNGTEG